MTEMPTQNWLRFDYFPAGRILMQQGGPESGSLIVLKEGEVEMLRDGKSGRVDPPAGRHLRRNVACCSTVRIRPPCGR